jgi:hypothetical protein
MDLRPLTDAEIDRLSEEELAEYQEHLEAIWRDKGRKRFTAFARMVEVPGAPTAGVKFSDFRRELAKERGEILEEDEPDQEEYYPKLLEPAEHHDLIMDILQDLVEETLRDENGDYADGAMIFAPPGSAKSSYTSMLAPAYFMGKYRNFNVIGASYAQSVADRFSRRARHIVGSAHYTQIFDASIIGDNKAVQNWSTTNGSEYRSTGIQAAVTSFRADLLLIDDPVAGREEADSEIIQKKTVQSFHDDLCSRLKPGGKIGLAMTRWNELDLGGHILGTDWKGQSGFWRGTDGRLWFIVNLPLLAEHADDLLGRSKGEILWPSWFRMKDAMRLQDNAQTKGASHARTWSSLYQQRPAPTEGAIIKRQYWKKWPEGKKLPEPKFVALFYDTAFEEEEINDPSAMTAWIVFESTSKKETGEEYNHDHLMMTGAWEEHVESVALPDIIHEHAKLFRPDAIVVEKRASGHYVIQELRRRRLPVKAWLPKGKVGTKGKVPRAWATALLMEPGAVWYVDGPKTRAVIDQCAAFSGEGTGKDDLLDTVTCAIQWMRDRFLYRHADEEMDAEEHRQDRINKIESSRPRRVYGEVQKPRIDDEDKTWDRLTDDSRKDIRRRLYGG